MNLEHEALILVLGQVHLIHIQAADEALTKHTTFFFLEAIQGTVCIPVTFMSCARAGFSILSRALRLMLLSEPTFHHR